MREAPHNVFAERAVIGALVLDQTQYHAVRRVVGCTDFYTERHRCLFSAIESILGCGEAVDAVSIHSQMIADGTVDKLGTVAYLSDLTNDCLPSHAEQYARIVRGFSIRRNIIAAGNRVMDEGYNLRIENEDLIGRARTAIVSACESIRVDTAAPVKETIQEAVDASLCDRPPEGVVYTGISSVDTFGGMFPGLMTVLGARPSNFKSGFALNVAANAALTGKKVLYVCLEDTALFLQFRLLARFAKVDSAKLRDRTMSHEEKMRVGDAKDIVGCLPIWIDDSGGKTSDDIRRSVLSHKDRLGLDFVVIDHLAHVADRGKAFDAITDAVKNIGEIPKEINAPLLLVSQLNREVDKRSERMPQLSDLRGSGEIEQRARMVWFLDLPKSRDDKANPNELRFLCAKNTHGNTGMVNLHVDLPQMFVTDWKGRGESKKHWEPNNGMNDCEY
jgi:replicative DNA helicase